MSLKKRLIIVYSILMGTLILFGIYTVLINAYIRQIDNMNYSIVNMMHETSKMEISKQEYVISHERYEANNVYAYLSTLNETITKLNKQYLSDQQIDKFELIKQELREYDVNFSQLISGNDQLIALVISIDRDIEGLNDNINELHEVNDNNIMTLIEDINLEIKEFYSDYLLYTNSNSVVQIEGNNHLITIVDMLNEMTKIENLELQYQIANLRMTNQVNDIQESLSKYVDKRDEFENTYLSLTLKSEKIGENLDFIHDIQKDKVVIEQNKVVIMTGVFLVMILLLFVLILNSTFQLIVRNVKNLLDVTDDIKEGDYDVVISPIEKNEFGKLSQAINEMTLGLKRGKQRDQEINERLEQLVEIRTQELNREKEKLVSIASTDELTGLLNRRAIFAALEDEIKLSLRYKHNITVMVLDLDHFKRVNDQFGHIAGDEVLRKLAHVFIKSIREVDLVGRIGGEEFLFIFRETRLIDAKELIKRIRTEVESVEFTFTDLHITFSAGVAEHISETSMELVNKADKRLYKAKEAGRNRVVYD